MCADLRHRRSLTVRRTESEDADSAISGDDPKSGCEADRKMGGKRGKSALSDAGSVEQTGI